MRANGIPIHVESVRTDGGSGQRGKRSPAASSARFPRSARGALRVVEDPDPAAPAPALEVSGPDAPPRLSIVGGRQRVVLAGGGSAPRAAVQAQLQTSLPTAVLLAARDVWDVLALAPRADLVVLAGDLYDAPADAVMRLLAHRHPDLNVISLAASTADPATAR